MAAPSTPRKAILDALGIQSGDAIERDAILAAQRRVAALPGVTAACVEPVCCEDGRATLYVGVQEGARRAAAFLDVSSSGASGLRDILCRLQRRILITLRRNPR
jgi:hypothetical protein